MDTLRHQTFRIVLTFMLLPAWIGAAATTPRATPRKVTVLTGHSDVVSALAWSPDGRRLASATPLLGDEARVWDVASGRRVGSVPNGCAEALAWSPNGKQLALGSRIEEWGVLICDSANLKKPTFLPARGQGKPFGWVFSVAWSPDGRRLAASSANGDVRVWEMRTREPLWTRACGHPPVMVAWNRSGNKLAIADARGSVALLRSTDGVLERRLQQGGGALTHGVCSPVVWSPDGRRVAAPGFQDSTVRIWDAATGRQLRVLTVPVYLVGSLSWNPDGKRLAGHAGDGVWVWDVATGQRQRALGGNTFFYSTVWSPDGKTLAVGCADGSIRLLDVAAGKPPWSTWQQRARVPQAGSDQGVSARVGTPVDPTRRVGMADRDGWEPRPRSPDVPRDCLAFLNLWSYWTLRIAPKIAPDIVVFHDGRILWQEPGPLDSVAGRCDPERWREGVVDPLRLAAFKGTAERNRFLVAQPDLPRPGRDWIADVEITEVGLAFGGQFRSLGLEGLDVFCSRPTADASTRALAVMANAIWALKPSVSRRYDPDIIRVAILSRGREREAVPWPLLEAPPPDQRRRGFLHRYSGANARAMIAALAQSTSVKIGEDTYEAVWVPALDTPQRPVPPPAKWTAPGGRFDPVYSLDWSPNGKFLASGGGAGGYNQVSVWDLAAGEPREAPAGYAEGVEAVRWSPDGTRIAFPDLDGAARLWNPATGGAVVITDRPPHRILSVDWSPDGQRLATVSEDGVVRLWSRTGALLRSLHPAKTAWFAAAWNPDGRRLAVAGKDGRIGLWDTPTGKEARAAGFAIPDGERVHSVYPLVWSPDGRHLATTRLGAGSIEVLDAATSRRRRLPSVDGVQTRSLAWSPDGRRLAGDVVEAVWIWDVHTRRRLLALETGGRIVTVAWSPDGRRLAVGDADGGIRVWEVPADASPRPGASARPG